LRIALPEKIAGFLRSGPGIESSGPGAGFWCRAFAIALGVVIATIPLAFSPLAPFSLKWAILGVFAPLTTLLWLRHGCGRPFRPLPRLVAPLLTFLLVSELSLLQAINLYYGLQQVAFLLVLFLLYLTVAYTCSQPDNRSRLVRALVLTLLAVSILALYGCTLAGSLGYMWPGTTLFRMFGNTNYGAAYLLTVIPFSAALYLGASRQWERVVWGTTLCLGATVLTLSMVRGAWVSIWIGLFVVGGVLVYGERHTVGSAPRPALWRALLLLGAGVLLAVAVWPVCLAGEPSFGARLGSTFDLGASSLQFRLTTWDGTLRMIWDHLWAGVGVGNFALAFTPYRSPFFYQNPGQRVEHPHNEFLNAGAELGLLGLLVLLWLVFEALRIGWRVASRSGARKEVLAGSLGGLVAAAAYANLFYVVHVPASAMNVVVLLGMLDGMDYVGEQKERGRPIRLAYLVPGLGVACLLFFTYFLRPLVGELHYFRAELDFRDKQIESGIGHLERSLAWNPQSYVTRYRRAVILFRLGKYRETIQATEETLKVHPKMEVAYGMMGSAYLKLGDREKAREIFMQALALNPYYPHALNNLGALAAQEGRIADAEALFSWATEVLGRTEMSPYVNLGNVYEVTGRLPEALEMYETAVAIKPQFPLTWYTVARLRVLNGDPAGAYAPLARAIALDEVWRARATEAGVFEGVRQGDPRVRILLRLE
jgi:tetratricopeptide (TPR) repeat protein